MEAAVHRIRDYGASTWVVSPWRIEDLSGLVRVPSLPQRSYEPAAPRSSGKAIGVVMIMALTGMLVAALGWVVL